MSEHRPDAAPAADAAVAPSPAAAHVAPGASAPAPVARASVATDVALVATFAAFVAVCAVLPAIPTGGAVPITLQTFGVVLTGLVLGPRRGALALLLYVAVGLAGVPVFSGAVGGLGVLASPSAGYLLAFPAAAAIAGGFGLLARRAPGRWRVPALFGAATAASLLVVHPLGIAVLGWRLGLSASEAVAAGAVFLPGDVIKNALAAVVAAAALRAFPDLLRGR
ncbi:biotin transporter BioY [Cellulomonas pakistanensis]|uniref:Biotin transporter BioY n=1 Tax=Cellulomonas pakistanensis TaxID=992287 RepID=A0A919U518_9CELL|nr:biotin transporter BioY [Cellulomonas pakistanensis]GIG35634.1 biotin transporter BioY [Cellulomonas pakistanensis]